MQLVYDRFETIESNLHKAYYHVEDVDPELWNKLNEDKDPGIFVSGYNITVPFNVEADNARNEAYSFFETNNLLCLAGLEYDITKVDSKVTSFSSCLFRFWSNLDPSLALYIEFGTRKIDYSLLKSLIGKKEEEKAAELLGALVNKVFGLEHYLDYLGIHLDSSGIKKGKDILAKDSALEFFKWFRQFEIKNSSDDYQYQVISEPYLGKTGTINQENANSYVHLLEYCVKRHETEYREWKTENVGLKGRKTAIISKIDFVIGRFSLQRLFYLYYIYVEGHILDKMFTAMNEEKSDGDLNKQLVEAVRNYPDPQFAIEVNERYKDYKRYNPRCIDLPFVDQDAVSKRMVSPSSHEDNTSHIDVRLGKYFEVSLEWEDVAALYNCFYQMFEGETKEDIIYYLAVGEDDGRAHNGIKWQGSREGLALFLTGVLPPKKNGFWKAVYKVFRIKKNDKWVDTKDLNRITSREWDTKKNREECESLESFYNNWMRRRPDLKGRWEFKDWRKKG